MYRKGGKGINQTFFRLRLIVLTALTTGMPAGSDAVVDALCNAIRKRSGLDMSWALRRMEMTFALRPTFGTRRRKRGARSGSVTSLRLRSNQ